jgi:hypothetical protein
MTLVLDAGALIALDRRDRDVWLTYVTARRDGIKLVSHGGVVGQAWRAGGARQASLARALVGIEVRALDEVLGRRAGALLAKARRGDVIDAALVLLARDGDVILTSDIDDLTPLAHAVGCDVDFLRV